MVDDNILELYKRRRVLLSSLTDGIRNFAEVVNQETVTSDKYEIITEMRNITDCISDLCNGDFILIDMYRRLSICLSKEEYETAEIIKNEIILYK